LPQYFEKAFFPKGGGAANGGRREKAHFLAIPTQGKRSPSRKKIDPGRGRDVFSIRDLIISGEKKTKWLCKGRKIDSPGDFSYLPTRDRLDLPRNEKPSLVLSSQLCEREDANTKDRKEKYNLQKKTFNFPRGGRT